jgi:hypothetical protein
MDNLRLIRFFTLAFLGLLLYQAWQQDYGQLQRVEPDSDRNGFTTYTGGVYYNPKDKYEKVDFDDMASKKLDIDTDTGWLVMILLTILIKAVFYKLSETSYKSIANMPKFTPRVEALKDRSMVMTSSAFSRP